MSDFFAHDRNVTVKFWAKLNLKMHCNVIKLPKTVYVM